MYTPTAPPPARPTPADLLELMGLRRKQTPKRHVAPPVPRKKALPARPKPASHDEDDDPKKPVEEVVRFDPRGYSGVRSFLDKEARWPAIGHAMLARVFVHAGDHKSLAALPAFGALEEAIAFHLLPRFFVPEACGTAWIYEAEMVLFDMRIRSGSIDPLAYLESISFPNAHGIRVERTITEGHALHIPFEHCLDELKQIARREGDAAHQPTLEDGYVVYRGQALMHALAFLHGRRVHNALAAARSGLACRIHTTGVGACYGNHDSCSIDPRIAALRKSVLAALRDAEKRSESRLALRTVAEAEELAPLCVRSGFDMLRTKPSIGHHRTVALTYFVRSVGVTKPAWLAFLRSAAETSRRPRNKLKEDESIVEDIYKPGRGGGNMRSYGCEAMRGLGFECHPARDIEDAHQQCADQLLVPLRYSKKARGDGVVRTAWHPCMYAREAHKQKILSAQVARAD